MTVASWSGPSNEDIERMVEESEKYAEAGKERCALRMQTRPTFAASKSRRVSRHVISFESLVLN